MSNKLVNIDLNGNRLTGNVSVTDSTSAGVVTLSSSGSNGTVTGTLSVNTPNADFVVGSGVTVTGNTTIVDVYSSTFINKGTLSTVDIQDKDASFVNAAGASTGDLTISSTGTVRITATAPIANVIVTGAGATVDVVNGTINTLTSKAAGVILTGEANVTNKKTDGGTLVGENGAPIVSVPTGVEAAINAINEGNALLANYTTAGITGVTAKNLAAVNAVVANAKATPETDLTKEGIQTAVDGLVSFTAEAAFDTITPYLSLYVLNEGGVQIPSNATQLETNLKNRLGELKVIPNGTDGRDTDSLQVYETSDVVFHSENIMFSADGKTIFVTGPLFSKAAFEVAKGAKTAAYKDPFNITLVKNGYVANETGSIKAVDKLAKIQISADGTATVVPFN